MNGISKENTRSEAQTTSMCDAVCDPMLPTLTPSAPPFDGNANDGRDPRTGRFAAGTSIGLRSRFVPENTAALVHGMRSRRLRGGLLSDQAAVSRELASRQAAIEADLGGPANLTVIHRDFVRMYVGMEEVARRLEDAIHRLGPLTTGGRTRALLTYHVKVVDQLLRLGRAIGVQRQAKAVGSLDDYIAHHCGSDESN
jgi:hypothetical protein